MVTSNSFLKGELPSSDLFLTSGLSLGDRPCIDERVQLRFVFIEQFSKSNLLLLAELFKMFFKNNQNLSVILARLGT
jgi:hypothetical protein